MPIILVLMTLVFGSLVAASLPVVIGVLSIVGSLGLLALLSVVTPVSNYALNVTTIIGLARLSTTAFWCRPGSVRSGRGLSHSMMRSSSRFEPLAARCVLCDCGGAVGAGAARLPDDVPAFDRLRVCRCDTARDGVRACCHARHVATSGLPNRLAQRAPGIPQVFGRRAPAEARAEEDGFWFRSSRLVMRRPVVMGGAVLLLALGLRHLSVPST